VNKSLAEDLVIQMCGCDSECDLTVSVTIKTATLVFQGNQAIIVDNCPKGPSPTDQLVEKREGYSIYQMQ